MTPPAFEAEGDDDRCWPLSEALLALIQRHAARWERPLLRAAAQHAGGPEASRYLSRRQTAGRRFPLSSACFGVSLTTSLTLGACKAETALPTPTKQGHSEGLSRGPLRVRRCSRGHVPALGCER